VKMSDQVSLVYCNKNRFSHHPNQRRDLQVCVFLADSEGEDEHED